MITVREPAQMAMASQNRLLDVDPSSVALYQQQQFAFDSSAINSGAGLEYRPDGVNRIKVVISGQGVMDLKNSSLAFRYRPVI
jgi:hypothetical protein